MENDQPASIVDYTLGLFCPVVAAVSVQQSILGYYASKNKLPSLERMQKTIEADAKIAGDFLPYKVFGGAGGIASLAGITAGAVAYLLLNPPRWATKSTKQHDSAQGRSI